ncbi:six-bladed beta-propeller -like protein [Colletotrichum asianum]
MPAAGSVANAEHNNTWFENLAVRSNGDILATRLNAPEVWLIEPATGKGRALVTIPGVLGTIGITEAALDIFVFGAGNLTISPLDVVPGSLKLFSLDLSRKDPEVELITLMPDAVFINGITPWSATEVLVADTILGAIYKVNTVTGAYETSLSGPDFAGANGVSVQDGYLYYTSSSNQTLSRMLVNGDLIPGPVKVIYDGTPVDDFVLAPDGTAYVATLGHNQVIRVDAFGSTTSVAGAIDKLDVTGATALRFGSKGMDSRTLYVTTNGATAQPLGGDLIEPAKIVAIKLNCGNALDA